MQVACRLHYDGMQEVAGCSSLHTVVSRLHTSVMQAACRLHYAPSVADPIVIHVHIVGVDAVMQGVDALQRPALRRRRAASMAKMQGVDALQIRLE